MTKIFSNNKYIEIVLEILVFLMAINFLHYGQLFLPLIALILFIDQRCKIRQPIVLAISIMFAISFFYFSRQLGFYSVMGFSFPFAVYIGSCIDISNSASLKKLIYLIGFGMALHVVLNFGYELTLFPVERIFRKASHFDIWTKGWIKTTGTAMNMFIFISAFYYLLRYEKKAYLKVLSTILFIVLMVYNLALGKRMVYIVTLMAFVISFALDSLLVSRKRITIGSLLAGLFVIMGLTVIVFVFWRFNIFNFTNLKIVKKFLEMGLKAERLIIYSWGFPLLGSHLWGGQEISKIIGIQFHDLFFDIYDYAGVISFALIIALVVLLLVGVVKGLKKVDKKIRIMAITVTIIIMTTFFIEPVMTGESLYLICALLIFSAIGSHATKN